MLFIIYYLVGDMKAAFPFSKHSLEAVYCEKHLGRTEGIFKRLHFMIVLYFLSDTYGAGQPSALKTFGFPKITYISKSHRLQRASQHKTDV